MKYFNNKCLFCNIEIEDDEFGLFCSNKCERRYILLTKGIEWSDENGNME